MSFEPVPPSVYTPFLRRFTDERARDLRETQDLYQRVRTAHFASRWSSPDIVDRVNAVAADIVVQAAKKLPRSDAVLQALDECQKALLKQETTLFSFSEVNFSRAMSIKEQVDLNRFLRAKEHFLHNEDRVCELLLQALTDVFAGIVDSLPPLPDGDDAFLSVPLLSLLSDCGTVVDRAIGTLMREPLVEAGLFTQFQKRAYENVCRVSGVEPYSDSKRPLDHACDSDLPPEELVEAYLRGTPFFDLFQIKVPFELDAEVRTEHHWLVGGTGHGKTNALMCLLANDLRSVARGERSVVVLDSQDSLIPSLACLPDFEPGGPLHGRLVLIDASDVEYPVALNLFDFGLHRIENYSMRDRERLLNTASEVMQFILASLLGADMTTRQSTLFGFALQAIQVIPEATIHTFRELMEVGGTAKFAPYLAKLQGRARDFFQTQFNAPIFAQTKQQVVARLFAICENRTFDRMLSNPRSKLDLFSEINSGKVILINTSKDLLKQEGTEIFGRFFLALIAQSAQERATLPASRKLPCYVYIDEAQDYLETDSNFTTILEQARKQRIGIIAAHQYLSQLSSRTLDSLHANTSIKMGGGISDRDAHALARDMRCEPSFIVEQPKGSFATYVRNRTGQAVSIRFPYLPLHQLPRMSERDFTQVIDDNRAKYAVHYTLTAAERPQLPEPEAPPELTQPDPQRPPRAPKARQARSPWQAPAPGPAPAPASPPKSSTPSTPTTPDTTGAASSDDWG